MKQSSPAFEQPAKERFDFDAIVVGAGFGGLRMLLELRKLGIPTRLLEAGTNVGGTWDWNRYPGPRTDSEFSLYTCLFGGDLLEAWSCASPFPPPPQVHPYLDSSPPPPPLRNHI